MKRSQLIQLVIIVLSAFFFKYENAAGQKPPVARVENVVDEYFGVKVNDPYRYMENLEDPYVKEWIKEQGDYSANILTNLPARQELLDRLVELDTGRPFSTYRYIRLKNGTLFFMKRNAGENLPKLYIREASGEERLLVDPEAVPVEEGEHYALWACSPSSNGEFLVYGLAKSGSEETILHILNIKNGDHLPETIDRIETAYNVPRWMPDGSGFFYSRRQLLPEDALETEIYKNTRIYFHCLNTPVEQDQLIAGTGYSDRMDFSDVDFPSMYLTGSSDHAVVKIKHGDSNELTLYTAPIKTLLIQNIPWKKICDVEDEVTNFAVHGNDIFLKSAKGAPRFKVLQTSLINPEILKAKTVIPEGEPVIDYVAASSTALYTGIVDGGFERILRLDYGNGNSQFLELPGQASGYVTSSSSGLEEILIRTSSWTKGSVIYS
jgi:prolyl oligopeptidase